MKTEHTHTCTCVVLPAMQNLSGAETLCDENRETSSQEVAEEEETNTDLPDHDVVSAEPFLRLLDLKAATPSPGYCRLSVTKQYAVKPC
jgi:hypothetical protein